MATIVFYGKLRCATNIRQRKLLTAAGHEVVSRDLLTESWTAERLRTFFAGLPVADWFNPAAPRVKSGALDVQRLSAERAMTILLAEPLLIRRPLIEIGELRIAGFDPKQLQAGLDLAPVSDAPEMQECSRKPETSDASLSTG